MLPCRLHLVEGDCILWPRFGCGLITVVVVSVYQILSLLQGRGRVSLWRLKEAMKITAFSGWFCFVVVDVYYEGALTMFFTTDKELPFKSIEVRKKIIGRSSYPCSTL